jgi:hypothetical protein
MNCPVDLHASTLAGQFCCTKQTRSASNSSAATEPMAQRRETAACWSRRQAPDFY